MKRYLALYDDEGTKLYKEQSDLFVSAERLCSIKLCYMEYGDFVMPLAYQSKESDETSIYLFYAEKSLINQYDEIYSGLLKRHTLQYVFEKTLPITIYLANNKFNWLSMLNDVHEGNWFKHRNRKVSSCA